MRKGDGGRGRKGGEKEEGKIEIRGFERGKGSEVRFLLFLFLSFSISLFLCFSISSFFSFPLWGRGERGKA